MAMTDPRDHAAPPGDAAPVEMIDGHSVDELDAYLAAGRTPYDPAIENSAACLLYLSALARLRERSWDALTHEAENTPDRDELWITGLLDTIRDEVRAGRDIPLHHPDPAIRLTLTEAAVHGLIRAAADALDGVLLSRTVLDGDITQPGAPISLTLTAAIEYGFTVVDRAELLRATVQSALTQHTELAVTSVDVIIEDVYLGRDAAAPGGEAAS
ncbi:Asp23/Gls24 family protein [Subtercola sp. Z020]|nr:Asp23/Gls24 family protein [Subtercola sp. Z020]